MTVRIYTDGAYSPKNDVGGWAFIVAGRRLRDYWGRSGAEATTTVNRMELRAIREALLWVVSEAPADNVCILTDSQYAVTVLGNERVYTLNTSIIEECRFYLAELRASEVDISVKWIKGHAGTPGNVMADIRAVRARDGFVSRLAALNR